MTICSLLLIANPHDKFLSGPMISGDSETYIAFVRIIWLAPDQFIEANACIPNQMGEGQKHKRYERYLVVSIDP